MPIELPAAGIVVLNIIGWPAIHFSLGWFATQLSQDFFDPQSWLFQPRHWERLFYEHAFAIKRWKGLLPDAAPWFRHGFPKKNLSKRDPAYLARYIQETCRGEAAHWMMMLAAPIFFLWNPWWADLIMVAYALLANLPCILAQRYNRLRVTRLLRPRH